DELRVDAARNLLQVTFPALGQEQGEEVDLEEEVAERVPPLLLVAALGGVRALVGLLDRVRDDRPRRLLAVPGTVAPQPLGELLQLEQRLGQRHRARLTASAGLRGRRLGAGLGADGESGGGG